MALQSLYERCDRLRPTLFRLASDTTDDNAALTQILAANDELTLVVTAYKELVGRRERNGGRSKSEEGTEAKRNGMGGFSCCLLFFEFIVPWKSFDLVFGSTLFCF